MMKKYFFVLLFLGCSSPKEQPGPLQTVTDFLAWYGANYKEANSFGLVNQGDSVFYSVNFQETEKFLAYMKSSGFVSEKFLTGFRKYFAAAQLTFEKDPMNEGPPMNFDYDIILWTQEPDLVIEKGKNPTVIFSSIRDDEATITLDVYNKLQFELSKENGTWKIDGIAPTGGS